jgi:hypothetical protein
LAEPKPSPFKDALKDKLAQSNDLDDLDRAYLTRWIDRHSPADEHVWELIAIEARQCDAYEPTWIYRAAVFYALEARRYASSESVRAGYDPGQRAQQQRRERLLELAGKADELARYFREAENYSGIANFFLEKIPELPALPEQVTTLSTGVGQVGVLNSNRCVKQLSDLHEREAQLLRQLAGKEPEPVTRISPQRAKREQVAFEVLMATHMREWCRRLRSPHYSAIAEMASAAFPDRTITPDDVRKACGDTTRQDRHRGSGTHKP